MNEIDNIPGASEGSSVSEIAFLARVGERVRAARGRKAISRKALSRLSDVSERHLAQLESGKGNVSMTLLKRIAEALDHPIEWLVGEDDPWHPDVVTAMALFRAAPAEQRRRVLEILDPDGSNPKRAQRIALIGLRGAGKSTLGRLSATSLGIPFVELNAEIEKTSGMPVNEVMALYGQEGYRRLERQAIENISKNFHSIVLAVAGGIVSEPDTYNYLLNHYHTIWLKARPEEHMERVRSQGDTRPMAGNPAAMEELRTILTTREALYARSDVQVDTSGRTVAESTADLLSAVERNRFLKATTTDSA